MFSPVFPVFSPVFSCFSLKNDVSCIVSFPISRQKLASNSVSFPISCQKLASNSISFPISRRKLASFSKNWCRPPLRGITAYEMFTQETVNVCSEQDFQASPGSPLALTEPWKPSDSVPLTPDLLLSPTITLPPASTASVQQHHEFSAAVVGVKRRIKGIMSIKESIRDETQNSVKKYVVRIMFLCAMNVISSVQKLLNI